ncbi:DUF397 domain-containing protein [Streptomyces sp. B21-102]|uniref:DUF397 domain-containing protein n=1 Tax=Streptomyces sp. B21-102 TaxID=3039416 RepID=UPI002FF2EF38
MEINGGPSSTAAASPARDGNRTKHVRVHAQRAEANTGATRSPLQAAALRPDRSGNCGEVVQRLAGAATVAVRDSKHPANPILAVGPAGFSVFLGWVTAVG